MTRNVTRNNTAKATKKWNTLVRVMFSLLLVAGLLCSTLTGLGTSKAYADETTLSSSNGNADKKLKNGSFEEGVDKALQYDESLVPYWYTTATDKKIELFMKNTSSYISNVTLTPTDGNFAAELNAEQESTLYQDVSTTPSSIYEWGLDHGGRNGMDTMALIIGPTQENKPSKPNADGRDQLMQMVDWLIAQGKTSVKTQTGRGEQITVFSKKFGPNGTFVGNAGNNAFSLTPSTIYTEEWRIWIMADGKASSGENPWSHYGSNAEGKAGSDGSVADKYYLYTVPTGQTSTMFAFVSVGVYKPMTTIQWRQKTLGNFLDNINFEIYYPLTASSTAHGSGTVAVNGGTSWDVTNATPIKASDKRYITEGSSLTLTATPDTSEDTATFVGAYYTDPEGNKNFVRASDFTESNGSYTYAIPGTLESAIDIHFIFVTSPTVTYDPNGGQPYYVDSNNTDLGNVYSFSPSGEGDATSFKDPYVSHEAEGYEGWKFIGWLLTGDNVTEGDVIDESHLLEGIHSVACNYDIKNASESGVSSQNFVVGNGANVFGDNTVTTDGNGNSSVKWATTGETTYDGQSRGLTMIAQWRWRQAFIPQIKTAEGWTNSNVGGSVTITAPTEESEKEAYDQGEAYYAKTGETVVATATPNENYTFEGWYDLEGNLVSLNPTYQYEVTKESVNTYYARFSGSVTQHYIRQVKDTDGNWKAIGDINDTSIAELGRYDYIDVAGVPISSTVTKVADGYKFIGWFRASDETEVTGDSQSYEKLDNDGNTLSYITKENATYYARFVASYTVNFAVKTKQADGSYSADDTNGGSVSVSTVTDIDGTNVSSTASANSGYKFLGWQIEDENEKSDDATLQVTLGPDTKDKTYYAYFEAIYNPTVTDKAYLSFVAESDKVAIPDAFVGRDAGTGKNTSDYGLDSKFGNTISTGFKYSIDNMSEVKTIQITVTVPSSAYVKVGGTSSFTGNGNPILTDSDGVTYNKGSIQQISSATTLTYYWDATGLSANTEYGFIIDNLYAPGATATITVNGTEGTKVTSENGVVNVSGSAYRASSHYPN